MSPAIAVDGKAAVQGNLPSRGGELLAQGIQQRIDSFGQVK
jgi:hypothetical protein